MRRKDVLKDLVKFILPTLVLFTIVEFLIRATYFIRNSMVDYVVLPYTIGHTYGPIPPWADALRILEPDEALFWRNRSNLRRRYIDVFSPVGKEQDRISLLRRFLPAIPESLKGNPVWEISLNSHGFRDVEFPEKKLLSAFRIICLGDSWTFGGNVGQEEAYPQQLRTMLKREFPEANFEVFNLGVLGYSSYQGLELLRRKVTDLAPDVVVIGFAMNDASVAGYRDKDLTAYNNTLAKRIGRIADKIESYKLLRYLTLNLTHKPKSVAHYLKLEHDSATDEHGWDLSDRRMIVQRKHEKLEPWTRVSPRDYEKNILEMINLARSREAGVILLHNELWPESPYEMELEKISKTEKVPLVDSSALVGRARRRIEEELEGKLDLRPPTVQRAQTQGGVEVIFRVYLRSRSVANGVYIVGVHPKLGNLIPNKVVMYDDGTHGDQRAGDKVWSYSVTFLPGTKLFYVYTNSGQEGKWEGLDVPYIRAFKVEAKNTGGGIYRPIESFGQIYMQADGWHTNAAGYELIAKALLKVLKSNEKVKDYLRQVTADRS